MAKKDKKIPYDQDNDIKSLVAYFTIINYGNANAIVDIFKRAGSTFQTVQIGQGTATKTVRDILGIDDDRKEIIIAIIREENVAKAKVELEAYFAASRRNNGIGFSISLTGLMGVRVYQFLANL